MRIILKTISHNDRVCDVVASSYKYTTRRLYKIIKIVLTFNTHSHYVTYILLVAVG